MFGGILTAKDSDIDINLPKTYHAIASGSVNFSGIVVSLETSTTPTKYGLADVESNTYYDIPEGIGTYVPIWSEAWFSGISFWLKALTISDMPSNETYGADITCNDFYELGLVLQGILNKVNAGVVFEPNTAHSQFLYASDNPVTNAAQCPLYITPITNITNAGYSKEQWKAECTVDAILELLRNAFNCYYDVYEDAQGVKHLRIEHVKYYLNGHSYTSQANNIDLTQMFSPMNRKPYSYLTGNWKYDLSECYDTIKTEWMDEQTAMFDGTDITIAPEDNIIDEPKTQTRNISLFDSDMENVIVRDTEVTKDGFLVVQPLPTAPNVVPYDSNRRLNFLLAMAGTNDSGNVSQQGLVKRFLAYNLFPQYIQFNGVEFSVQMRKRIRENDVKFNTEETLDASYSVITNVGIGHIDSLLIDHTCNNNEVTLKYELEQ